MIRIAKLLESYENWVQMSAFECWLSPVKHKKFMKKLNDVAWKDDNIIIYQLNRDSVIEEKYQFKTVSKCDVYVC